MLCGVTSAGDGTASTGHQHHFLSRLDRLALPQVELALHLYRDHDLVRFILGWVKLPDGADRIALSLDHPADGPFLIVTREGRFVTCLGAGMQPGDTPVVTRGQLDAIAAKHHELASRLAACRDLVGEDSMVSKMIRRIYDLGDGVSREDFIAVSAVQPLLGSEFMRLQVDATGDLADVRPQVLAILRRTERPKPYTHDLLRAYWKTFWLLGHLAVLVGLDGRTLLGALDAERIRAVETFYSRSTFEQTILATAVKGLWSVGKMGKVLLANYKRAYASSTLLLEQVEASLGLAILGLRHASVRAEARKALASIPAAIAAMPPESPLRQFADAITTMCDWAFDEPHKPLGFHLSIGAAEAVARTAALPAGASFRFASEKEVPEELAMTLAVNREDEFLNDRTALLYLYGFVPWLAKAAPESLYLPRAFLEATRRPWTPERTIDLLRGQREHARALAATPKRELSRSGPCPCGSGKKYKRCCGA
jgi:hypothetical protein